MRNYITVFLVITALIVSGCAQFDKLSTYDKANLAAFWGIKAADTITTMEGMDRGGTELNPILGEHPSDGTLVAASLLSCGIVTGLYLWKPESKLWRWMVTGLNVVGVGVVINNLSALDDMEE